VESPHAPDALARRYVAWLRRNALAILTISMLVLGGAIYLIAFHLPLRADFSYLLPQDARAVRDLRRLESRVQASETVLVIFDGNDPAVAAQEMENALVAAQSPLIARVSGDDAAAREFVHARRHLFVPADDLQQARDALKHRIDRGKLEANPLYVDLGDGSDAKATAGVDKKRLADLHARRREAEAKLARPTNISADGSVAKLEVATTFRATDATRGEQLVSLLRRVRAEIRATHPGVTIGFTGTVVTALAEHHAISRGIVRSSLLTALLVALLLALYFRSALLLTLLVGTIAIATAVSFGAAVFTVGHLNAATAFLGAIIAGNGINYGILLIARFLEERRRHEVDDAVMHAIVGTLRPTAVASLGAAIAYGSLAATSFKGFADFAVIGAVGMLVCWVATYTLLPALLLHFGRCAHVVDRDRRLGAVLARLLGFKRSSLVVAVAVLLFAGAGVIVDRYIANDPFEYNIRKLRSVGADAENARHWMQRSDASFGRGLSGRTYIAAERIDQVPLIVDALAKDTAIGKVESIQTFVPPGQARRLALLAEIRTLLDQSVDALPEAERAELAELRPPDDLRAFTIADLPASLRERLTEKDGRVGLLLSVRPALDLDEWNGKDLIRFATAVRELHLADRETVTTSGSSVIFADIVAAISHDGSRVTLLAFGGLLIMVLLLVGPNRQSIAVMTGTVGGSLLMIAACALLDIKVSFLDFVALPITLGLGIDYAINVAHRHDETDDPIATLRTSGAAVLVCSMTTMIGYGSLLVSENLAIRGFGTASLIGEITTVLSALVLVRALLAVGRSRR